MENIPSDTGDNIIANQENDSNGVNVSPQQRPDKMPMSGVNNTQNIDNIRNLDISPSGERKFCTQMCGQTNLIADNLMKIPTTAVKKNKIKNQGNINENDAKVILHELPLQQPTKSSENIDNLARRDALIIVKRSEEGNNGKYGEEFSKEEKLELERLARLPPTKLAAEIEQAKDECFQIGERGEKEMKRGKKLGLLTILQ